MTKAADVAARSVLGGWKQAFSASSWITPFFRQYRKALFASLALGVLTLVFACGLMFTSGYLIDLSAERPELGVWALFVPLAFVQVFGIGRPFIAYIERLVSHDWVLHMTSELRRRLYKCIDAHGVFWTMTRRAGETLGLLSEDIGHVQNLYLRSIFPQVIACAVGLVACIAFGAFSWLCALVALFVVLVLVFVVPLVAVLANAVRQRHMQRLGAELYIRAYDNVSGVADWMFAQRAEQYVSEAVGAYDELLGVSHELKAAARRRELIVQVVLCAAAVALTVWAAVHFGTVVQDAAPALHVRPADWLAAFALGFFPLIEGFVPLSEGAVQAEAHFDSLERLDDIDVDVAREDGKTPQSEALSVEMVRGIELSNVHFAFDGSEREVVSGVDLRVAPGEKVAVLGPSGAGKSTLLSLIRGDLAPTAGTVTCDGTACCEFGDDAAQVFGVIQQDTYLFNQTLLENLAMGDESISEADAERALRQVGLEGLLQRLPKGVRTIVDAGGTRFSGGERHRIALARVLLQDAPVVLLDEPCVSLDPITERALLNTLFEVLKDRTVIMVTHHLLGVEHVDRVVFIDGGAVVIDGAPAELEKTSERYRQLIAFDRGL